MKTNSSKIDTIWQNFKPYLFNDDATVLLSHKCLNGLKSLMNAELT